MFMDPLKYCACIIKVVSDLQCCLLLCHKLDTDVNCALRVQWYC